MSLVLIAEDAPRAAQIAKLAVRCGLELRAVRTITSEHAAYAMRTKAVIALVPDQNAHVSLRWIVRWRIDAPILVLQPGMTPARRASLLEEGAAACENLPITAQAFQATLRMLRRGMDRRPASTLWLDQHTHRVGAGKASVRLSPHEFALLQCLAEHAGEPVSCAQLKLYAWGERLPQKSSRQIVAVLICRLRRKIAQIGLADAIEAVHRQGYAFRSAENMSQSAGQPHLLTHVATHS